MQTYDWMVGGKSGQEESKLIGYHIILSQNVPNHDLLLIAKSKPPDKNVFLDCTEFSDICIQF
jgi:hypothetical protein